MRRWGVPARLALVACAATIGALGSTPGASACSCAPGDPRDQYAEADAAILGDVVAREVEGERVRHTIRVTRTFKGEPGSEVILESHVGDSCANHYEVGTKVSLLLHLSRGRWTTFPCDYVSAEQMERVSQPLPRPNGRPPMRFLLGGSLGPARTIGLDGAARTLGYGYRDGLTWELDACPGAATVAEHATVDRRHVIALRRLPSLRLVWSRPIGPERPLDVAAVGCGAGRVVALVLDHTSRPDRLISVGRSGVRTLWTGTARTAAIGSTHAYVPQARGFLTIDVATGAARHVALDQRFVGAPALDEPRRRLALQTRGGLAVYDVARSPRLTATRSVVRRVTGTLAWGSSRLGIFPRADEGAGRAQIYTARLGYVRSFAWGGDDPVIANGTVFGLDWEGQVVARSLRRGPLRVVRTFDTPELYELALVPTTRRSAARASETRFRNARPRPLVVSAGCREPAPGRRSTVRARSAL